MVKVLNVCLYNTLSYYLFITEQFKALNCHVRCRTLWESTAASNLERVCTKKFFFVPGSLASAENLINFHREAFFEMFVFCELCRQKMRFPPRTLKPEKTKSVSQAWCHATNDSSCGANLEAKKTIPSCRICLFFIKIAENNQIEIKLKWKYLRFMSQALSLYTPIKKLLWTRH